MELWIRSQNKECLIKIDRLDIDYTNGSYKIEADGYQTLLAKYKTKGRALEVLDEIQKHIAYNEIEILSGNACNISYDEYVYEMPKE